MNKFVKSTLLCVAMLGSTAVVQAQEEVRNYEVTITNATKALQFTPILAAVHSPAVRIFRLGRPATPQLADLAEGGAIGGLADLLVGTGEVASAANSAEVLPAPPLLFPGQSVTLKLSASGDQQYLSMAAMLLPTNDSFMALDTVLLPMFGRTEFTALGYDSGTEVNDELCANIPGPRCGGEGTSPQGGEGHVHISNGMHGHGDLSATVYDWRNPVATVLVRRVRN